MNQTLTEMQLNMPAHARDCLQIRYVRLHFSLELLEDTELPANKASMLRGGMGEMLLRMNCIRDRKCKECDFVSECLVRRTMYSQMENTPAFMQSTDSVGYVLDCENYRKEFSAGDTVEFTLTLFGKTIVYFSQFLQAFQYLGVYGMGRNHARYRIQSLTSSKGESILDGNNIYMANLCIMHVADYVEYRWEKVVAADYIVFHTPLAVKYQGEMLEHLDPSGILAACERRVRVLNDYEGNDVERFDWRGHVPEIEEQRVREVTVHRFSSTHVTQNGGRIPLRGIVGDGALRNVDDTARALLLAGELLHIGKNTSFGFGRYTLIEQR